jgi:ribose transport system permease protein
MTARTNPAGRTSLAGGDAKREKTPRGLTERVGKYGLLIFLIVTFGGFSLARPSEFATWLNVKTTLDQQTPVIIGGLAAMIPLLTGEIDLSVAANISLGNVFLAGLTTNNHFSTPVAVILAILVSTAVGVVNGLIVVKLQVTSFVATLGMATLIGGVGLAYSHSTDILTVPSSVTTMVQHDVFGLLPLSVVYGIAAMLIVALVLRYLPVGRKLRAVGANPRAAALTGIRPGLYKIASFTFGGALAGIAGVVITGQLGSATAAGTADALLLPIFAAVFLGSTAFTPGRPNVPGLFVAALFLAFVSSGLVLLGASLWVSPLINGAALILAVAFSTWAARMQASQFRAQQLKQLDVEDAETPRPSAEGLEAAHEKPTPSV